MFGPAFHLAASFAGGSSGRVGMGMVVLGVYSGGGGGVERGKGGGDNGGGDGGGQWMSNALLAVAVCFVMHSCTSNT